MTVVFVGLVRVDVWNINMFMAEQQNRGHHEHVRDHDVDGERGDVSISNWDLEQVQLGLDLKAAGNEQTC